MENEVMNLAEKTVSALATTLQAVEPYVPTKYVDYSEPDIDAEHLNHAENAIKLATDALNLAISTINTLSSAVDQLNRDITSGYLNLNVKTTKIAGVTREVNFSNGIGKVSGTELIGFTPKWGWGIVAAFRMNEATIIPEIAFDGTDYVYKLPQKPDYSGTIWMTALIMGTKS